MIRFKEKKKELTIDEYNKFISLINSYDSNIKALDHNTDSLRQFCLNHNHYTKSHISEKAMQQHISFTFLKNIKSSFWRYIQTFRKLCTYPTYLHPKLRIS